MTRAAAFFDVDRTLIRGSAAFPLAIAAYREGWVSKRELARDFANLVSFTLNGASDERSAALRERILRAVVGHRAADVRALADTFAPDLAAKVFPAARRLLDEHAARGEDRILVSASPVEIVERLADQLNLEGAVGTRGAVDAQGRYDGTLDGDFCYGEGKVHEVQRMAHARGYDLAQSTAYSDSISDLPFLDAVGHPVAVNPDRELRQLARARRWPIVEVAHGWRQLWRTR